MECAMLKQAGLRGRTACYTTSVGSIQRSSQDWGYLGAIGVLARARPSLVLVPLLALNTADLASCARRACCRLERLYASVQILQAHSAALECAHVAAHYGSLARGRRMLLHKQD